MLDRLQPKDSGAGGWPVGSWVTAASAPWAPRSWDGRGSRGCGWRWLSGPCPGVHPSNARTAAAPPSPLTRPPAVAISLFSDGACTPKRLGRWCAADAAGIKAGICRLATMGGTNFQVSFGGRVGRVGRPGMRCRRRAAVGLCLCSEEHRRRPSTPPYTLPTPHRFARCRPGWTPPSACYAATRPALTVTQLPQRIEWWC